MVVQTVTPVNMHMHLFMSLTLVDIELVNLILISWSGSFFSRPPLKLSDYFD